MLEKFLKDIIYRVKKQSREAKHQASNSLLQPISDFLELFATKVQVKY